MSATTDRLSAAFERLADEGRAGLVTFITAGDPDRETSQAILQGLPDAGADIIELGMPFSDPMADGPAIQAASLRALENGASLVRTLEMVTTFRESNPVTPIILMGYFNPIYQYGVNRFVNDAGAAGVDGLILVDLPPEEDDELCDPARTAGLHWIRLVTPTTKHERLNKVLENSSGFVYYVSIAGITGTRSAETQSIGEAVQNIRASTSLPIAVGFGIRTPQQVREVAAIADAVVVGSAIVEKVATYAKTGDPGCNPDLVGQVLGLVGDLAEGLRS